MTERDDETSRRRDRGAAWPLAVLGVLAMLVVGGLVGAGCSKDEKAGPTQGSVANGSATTVADALEEFPAPAGAEVALASTTLDVGEAATFRGSECPAGQRGNLAILPGDGPQ